MSKFDIPIEQREADEEAEEKRRELLPSNLDLIAQLRAPCGDSVTLLTAEGSTDKFDLLRLAAAREIERLTAVIKHAIDEGDFCQECAVAKYVLRPGLGLPDKDAPAPESRDG